MTSPKIKIETIDNLLDWLEKQGRVGIVETGEDYFILQCPCGGSTVTVSFNATDDIDDIIYKTIDRFKDFDANEEFTELWDRDFANRNPFTPRQFIDMLTEDEQFLHDTAYELKQVNR